MIIDARRANQRMRNPPGISMCTTESLARIEVILHTRPGDDQGSLEQQLRLLQLTLGMADVESCFHRIKIDKGLAKYFGLLPVKAKDLGMAGTVLEGRVLLPDDYVTPFAVFTTHGVLLEPVFCSAYQRAPIFPGACRSREPTFS